MTVPVKQAPKPPEEKLAEMKTPPGTDLLKNRLVAGMFRSKWFPGILQWPTAAVFLLIMYILLFGPTLAHSNFGTALTWILWWPLIPIMFLLAGRFWCAICPFGKLSDVVQKFVGNNRPVPTFLRKYGIWMIDVMFILITWGDHVFGVVESPWGSGVLMLMITTGVVGTAVLWERRAWCRYLCFLGGLSSNYSQTGMLALRGTPEKCSKCKVSACYKGNGEVPGCPMFEFPRTMDSSAQCNLCGNCVKVCPNNSITLTTRVPTKELWSVRKPEFASSFLAVVIMGIVFVQNFTMLEVWQSVLTRLENVLGTDNYFATFTVTFLIALSIPVILLGLVSFLAKKANGASLVENFTRFGYSIIALDVAGHVAHNLFHLFAEGGTLYITGAAFFGKTVEGVSPALLDNMTIQILQFGLIGLGVAGSLYTAYKISGNNYPNKKWATVLPYGILILFLGVVNIISFSLPMAMRM